MTKWRKKDPERKKEREKEGGRERLIKEDKNLNEEEKNERQSDGYDSK